MTNKVLDFAWVTIDQYMKTTAWPTWAILKDHIENHFQIDMLKVKAYKKLLVL